jgi:diguanylate cyclase (GGDEF)-like protein/PAS domain S-box-containing protein
MQTLGIDESVVQSALQDGELHKAVLDQLEEGVYMLDRDRRILYWNAAAERISGYLKHDVAGQLCYGDLMMQGDPEGAVVSGEGSPIAATMLDGKPRESSVFMRHRDGHRMPVRVHSKAIHDSSGAIIGAVEMFEEVLRGAERHPIWTLHDFGCLDSLTNAANRRYGEMRVRQSLEALSMFEIPFGWLRIGLDGLEELERHYGHGVVDGALKLIAGTLDSSMRPLDVLTRWGKTEFRAEVHYSSGLELGEITERLVTLVRVSNLQWWGDRVRVTVSVAGAAAEQGDTLESLEARVGEVFESCRAGGGDRAAIAHATVVARKP